MELEEVAVIGRRLYRLQYELVKAQDRFFARYNDLNTNDDFDIHCSYRAPTGTTLRKRECQVEFILEHTGQQGRDFLESLTSSSSRPATSPPNVVWLERREEFRENFRQQLRASPELRQLMLEWQQQQARYEKAREARREDRPAVSE